MLDTSKSNSQGRKRFFLDFFLVNAFLASLILFYYIPLLPHLKAHGFLGFFVISFVAQMTIIFSFCFILMTTVHFVVKKHGVNFILSIVIAAALIFALICDAITFNLFHLHYGQIGWEVISAGALSQVISLSFNEIALIICIYFIIFAFEYFIAQFVWKNQTNKNITRLNYILTTLFLFCVLTSYSLNFVARRFPGQYGITQNDVNIITKALRFVPYYNNVYRLITAEKSTVRYLKINNDIIALEIEPRDHKLNYPKHALFCQPTAQPYNIVLIVVDSWRYDTMNSTVTPTIYHFAQQSSQFTQNWSGGNATQPGLFTLFYGIPGNYWQAMLEQKHSPELIHQLIKHDYVMGIFSSAQLNFPAFDQTLFREVKPLNLFTLGATSVDRDQNITQEFKTFLSARNPKQPFFSMVFYDAVHNYCEANKLVQQPFSPAPACNRLTLNTTTNRALVFNRYLNSVHFVDSQINEILISLEQQHLMQNTIVVITADHGEEINDKNSGYWQHASAYTSYQLHTPLIIHWPNLAPKIYSHFTSNYDFAPTLLQQVLNCKNPVNDYSTGTSLFDEKQNGVFISGSYGDNAIISNNQIFRIFEGGDYEIDDETGHPIAAKSLQTASLKEAFLELNAFFK